MIRKYLSEINMIAAGGDAREESYYPALAELFYAFAIQEGKERTRITILPKKTEAGNPDFRIWDGTVKITGYIEAKIPGTNLETIENSEQIHRYLNIFPNFILTDFYEFRLYRNGVLIDKSQISRSGLAKKGIDPPLENTEKTNVLFSRFFSFAFPAITSADQLAHELAIRTRFLRDEVIAVELEQQHKGKGELFGFFETFRKFLLSKLTEKEFADLFAQTITYGLFAARTRSRNGFNRKLAYDLIPRTIGILRNIFRFVSQGDLPVSMEVIVDDIAEALNETNVNSILHQFYKDAKGDDPIVHFYETFLREYDPETREKRGVYYTPEPVVGFIVRSVHQLLKSHFGITDGFAGRNVTVLDPAAGTLTFSATAIRLAINEFQEKFGKGGIESFIRDQILNNFLAFELMMAPYAIGHIKMSFLFDEFGYKLKDDERFKLFLTNTLDMEDLEQTNIPGLESLSDESHAAGKIKKTDPVLVIIGNPPYSASSANINPWTEKMLKEDLSGAQSYYKIDGNALNEQNSKLLQDDYVKFLRFAQWKIQQTGKGIVGMITNHAFLNNVTFRGMRQSLMGTFNEIFITDLHGDSLKKEKAPDGGKDENVFDIRKGVSISIFVKLEGTTGCKIYHQDIYGLRNEKYHWLRNHSLQNSVLERIEPKSPWYFLFRHNIESIEYYNNWKTLPEIFPVNATGVKTHRDEFAVGFSRPELTRKISAFSRSTISDEVIRQTYHLSDSRDWKLSVSRKKFFETTDVESLVCPYLYRPFDHRFVIYSEYIVDWPRIEIMQHLFKPNIALCVGRQGYVVGEEFPWNLAFITDKIPDVNLFYRGGVNVFPLYLFNNEAQRRRHRFQSMMVFEPEDEYGQSRSPNIRPVIFDILRNHYGITPEPESIMNYIYAVLFSDIYRVKYAQFLRIDFPRIPFAIKYIQFLQMAMAGEELINLHLLKSRQLDHPSVRFEGAGSDTIMKPVYNQDKKVVFINETKYFEKIEPEIWNYRIGGYQILEKYLKDRKGLPMNDPVAYCRIASAIDHTKSLQNQIDENYSLMESEGFIS